MEFLISMDRVRCLSTEYIDRFVPYLYGIYQGLVWEICFREYLHLREVANWLNCVWHIAMYIKRAFMGGGLKLKLIVTNNYIINLIFHTLFGVLRIVLYVCFRRGLHPREGRGRMECYLSLVFTV